MFVHHISIEIKNCSLKCDPLVLIVFGLGVWEGQHLQNMKDVAFIHRPSFQSYNDDTNVGGME